MCVNLQVLLAALVGVRELLGQGRHLVGVELEGTHQQRDVLSDRLPQTRCPDLVRNLAHRSRTILSIFSKITTTLLHTCTPSIFETPRVSGH